MSVFILYFLLVNAHVRRASDFRISFMQLKCTLTMCQLVLPVFSCPACMQGFPALASPNLHVLYCSENILIGQSRFDWLPSFAAVRLNKRRNAVFEVRKINYCIHFKACDHYSSFCLLDSIELTSISSLDC